MRLNCQETFGKYINDCLVPYTDIMNDIEDLAEEPDFSLFQEISKKMNHIQQFQRVLIQLI